MKTNILCAWTLDEPWHSTNPPMMQRVLFFIYAFSDKEDENDATFLFTDILIRDPLEISSKFIL